MENAQPCLAACTEIACLIDKHFTEIGEGLGALLVTTAFILILWLILRD